MIKEMDEKKYYQLVDDINKEKNELLNKINRITIRISPELNSILNSEAIINNTNKSEIIRKALYNYFIKKI